MFADIQTRPGLEEAIQKFAEHNPELSTPAGASLMCTAASAAFIDMLLGLGVLKIEGRRTREWEVQEIAVINGMSHWVARIGVLCIDWTARQFEPQADWPKMWEDPEAAPVTFRQPQKA